MPEVHDNKAFSAATELQQQADTSPPNSPREFSGGGTSPSPTRLSENGLPSPANKSKLNSHSSSPSDPAKPGSDLPLPQISDRSSTTERPSTASEAFSLILEGVGSDGKWQWYLFFITAACGNFTALHNLGAVFLAAEPQHWCQVPGLQNISNDTYGRDLRNASIPLVKGANGKMRFARCTYYVRDYDEVVASLPSDPDAEIPAPPANTTTTTCSSWNYDTSIYTNTIVSEWDLVCEDRWLMSSAQASYMFGFMFGALILSELADKFGRRPLLLWSTVFFAITTIATDFSTSYLMFLSMRFFVAAFGSGIFLSNFVILMESLGMKSRTWFGVLYHICFSTGMCILAFLGYLLRDWRDLQLATSVPTILMLVYFFIIPESPRWLMMEGRHEEALVILRKMASVNGGQLPEKNQLDVYIEKIDQERSVDHRISFSEKCLSFMNSQLTLVRTPNMRSRCLIIFFAWFVVSMIYYGLAFNGDNLNLPPYTLMGISGMVEFAACFFNIWILKKCGRRISLCILLVVCGVACLVIVFVPVELSWVNLTLSCIGRFFISPGFNVVFMYSAELVPTHVRNVALGTSSMCARIGSGIAPYIVTFLGENHYWLPSTLFGGLAVTSGLLSLLLPETGNKRLPESVKEIEAMDR